MTDKEIIQKAIEIAMGNGYKEPFMFGMGSDFSLDKFHVFKLYFSHDFAKAFWGEKLMNINRGDFLIAQICWRYHLQQMVLEENPIDYLRKFIAD